VSPGGVAQPLGQFSGGRQGTAPPDLTFCIHWCSASPSEKAIYTGHANSSSQKKQNRHNIKVQKICALNREMLMLTLAAMLKDKTTNNLICQNAVSISIA
jgi:hypothetical protein